MIMGSHDLVRFRKCRTGISHTNANCKIYFIVKNNDHRVYFPKLHGYWYPRLSMSSYFYVQRFYLVFLSKVHLETSFVELA